ncbi:putative protein N(5)-glutamine methyltransferase [Nakamurella sp. YIM 132087]|uniref:peptide chain release factor N(5)-glutamine methyltransferase n=1 Tax=Nakamurella alba TaxID=2665158 RepID=A0A7K1FKY7_9ACTN|nr:putative protein N(5)-glutamine methyltransferase [Nakamurella alba]MTD14812.1 putative protein N(5)-glutamine methyltransferase [Nakamurella alba]
MDDPTGGPAAAHGADEVGPVAARLRAAGCVFAEEEAALLLEHAATPDALERLIGRRVAGEPLEHLLGWAEFRGRRLAVAPRVFVPRLRTGILVDLALAPTLPAGAVVVELCCGVGAVSDALLQVRPDLQVVAADIDHRAVSCARVNLGDRATVLQGDLFDALPKGLRGTVDLMVANAPYVPTAEIPMMPAEARDHESATALDGGADGLDLHRRILAAAPVWLRPGGAVLLESSPRQAAIDVALAAAAGLTATVFRDEEIEGTAVRAVRS